MRKLRQQRDMVGLIPVKDNNDMFVMVAGTAQTVTVPAGATHALFSYTSGITDLYVKLGDDSTYAIPIANVTDLSGPLINPALEDLGGAATLGIITAGSGNLAIYWYTS